MNEKKKKKVDVCDECGMKSLANGRCVYWHNMIYDRKDPASFKCKK